MNNNQKLIDAVHCKFPQNNLTEIYYNIGRILPFTAQRFPDGRVSDWYRDVYKRQSVSCVLFAFDGSLCSFSIRYFNIEG